MWFFIIDLAIAATTPYSWIQAQTTSIESQDLMLTYPDLRAEFANGTFSWLKTQMARSANAAYKNFSNNNCQEGALFKSMDAKMLFPDATETEATFVSSLILVESSYCLPNVQLDHAYKTFMSPDFREDVMPQVIKFTNNNHISCVQSEGITGLLKPSQYCSKDHVLHLENAILLRSSLKTVEQGSAFQPLYIREDVMLFVQMQDGVGVYRGSFTRSDELGSTGKYILRSTVESSQNNIRNEYYEWLQK